MLVRGMVRVVLPLLALLEGVGCAFVPHRGPLLPWRQGALRPQDMVVRAASPEGADGRAEVSSQVRRAGVPRVNINLCEHYAMLA
jgi:hypothetical protein